MRILKWFKTIAFSLCMRRGMDVGQRRGDRRKKRKRFDHNSKFNMIVFTLNHSIGIYNNLRINTIYSNLLNEMNFILSTCHQRKPYL